MSKCNTVPNQKIIIITKSPCSQHDLYAKINIAAMEHAAQTLDAGAFKLWCYFAKNQAGYQFALSSADVEKSFGIKIKQYTNAINNLIDQNYLVITKGNNVYEFKEYPVITKGNNDVITLEDNVVITKGNNDVITKSNKKYNNNTTPYTTINITTANKKEAPLGTSSNPILTTKEWLAAHHNDLIQQQDGLYQYAGKIYKMSDQ